MSAAAGPDVVQNSATMRWVQLKPKTSSSIYRGITTGSDGNIWFANQNQLVRVTMAGGVKAFNLTFSENGTVFGFGPIWLGTGADGKLYLSCVTCTDPIVGGGIIGVATTTGKLAVHRIPSKDLQGNNGFGVGPDGNTWFAEEGHIAKITPTGTITEYPYPSGETQNTSSTPVAGPDGNVWFTDYYKLKVGNVKPSTGKVTEYDVSSKCSGPQGLAVGTDNKLYFNCSSGSLDSITTAGAVGNPIANPYGTSTEPGDMIKGSNGHIWFAPNGAGYGEYNESTGTLIGHVSPFNTGIVVGLTSGPDTNVWGTDNAGFLNVYLLATLSVKPKSLSFTGTGQIQTLTATYVGPSVLSAISKNTAIATVAPGATKNTFNVTSQAAGKTTVVVEDAIGNLFNIAVTVQ